MSDELNDLLAQLDDQDPPSTALTADAHISGEQAKAEPPRHPGQELMITEPIRPESVPTEAADPNIDYSLFIQQYLQDYKLASARIDTDRRRMVTIMDTLYRRVDGGQATDIETESLVKLIGSLSDTNGHFTRLMDSMSKVMSAAKPAMVINQNIGGQSEIPELTAILQQSDDD